MPVPMSMSGLQKRAARAAVARRALSWSQQQKRASHAWAARRARRWVMEAGTEMRDEG